MPRPNLAVLNEDFPKVKNTDAREVSGLINFIIGILNIKTFDDPDEIKKMNVQMLLVGDLIRTKFGNLTIPEIKEAFKMYVSKELELKVFRMLDCIAVGEVLTAYTDFRNEILKVYEAKKRNLLIAVSEQTDIEKEIIKGEYLKVVFDEIQATGLSLIAWHLFLELEAKGKIVVSVSEKKELYKKQLRIYEIEEKSRIRTKHGRDSIFYLRDLEDKITGKNIVESVSNKCRSILVSKYLKNHVEDFETFKKSIE